MENQLIANLPFSIATRNSLNLLVSILLNSGIECSEIILFGSYARAEQKVGSDFDILVLSKKDLPREIRGALHADFDERNADIVFYQKDKFMKSNVLLVQQIRKDGILLWKN